MTAAWDGRVFIADTSAWMRSDAPRLRSLWTDAIAGKQVATCPIVALEILRGARDGADFDAKTETLATLRDIPITRAVTNAALTAYRELAHRQPLLHRSVKLPDVLIAAAAAEAGVGVLHYDADYDTLATVLRFESRWIARRGSLA